MDEREELYAQAVEMGLNPDKRLGADRLRKLIAGERQEPTVDSIPALADYIADIEHRHAHRDVFVVEVSHPTAEERVYPGKYSGIRVKRGPLSVRYSDGTKE